MDATIFLFLLQDGIINGAVYALVAIATVLVFAVTRVILPGAGHIPWLEEPAEFPRHLLDFLAAAELKSSARAPAADTDCFI